LPLLLVHPHYPALLLVHLHYPAVGAEESGGFRYFWMCDSCPQTVRDVSGKAPFEVLSLAEPIAAALQI